MRQKKTKPVLLILLLLYILPGLAGLAGCRPYQGPSPDHLETYLEAKKLYLQGNLKGARPLLEELTTADRKFYQAAFLLGKINYFDKEWEQAREVFEGILKQHPAHGDAELWLVRTLLELDDAQQAEQRLQKLLRYDPQDPRLLYQLARIYLLKDDYKNALVVLKQAALYREEFAKVFLELGRVYNSFGQQEQALKELRFTRELLPEDSLLGKPITELIGKIEDR